MSAKRVKMVLVIMDLRWDTSVEAAEFPIRFANFKLMQDELAFIDPPACPPFLGTRFPIG